MDNSILELLPHMEASEIAERIDTFGYELGIIAGFERVSEFLLTDAGKAYARGNDDEAKLLRNLGLKFQKDAKHLREDFDSKKNILTAFYLRLDDFVIPDVKE